MAVDFDVHHDEVVVRVWLAVVLQGLSVNPSEALLIGAGPDTSLAVFAECHHYRRIAVLEVAYAFLVSADAVDAVFVSTHPSASLTVGRGTGDEGIADSVLGAQLTAHIVEAAETGWLQIDAFLHHAYPEVAAGVFGEGVDLASGQVDLHAEVGVGGELTVARIENGDALAVVADEYPAVAVTIECRHSVRPRTFDMNELLALLHVYTRVGRAHVDGAIGVLAETVQVVAFLEVLADGLSVVAHQSEAVGGYPQALLAVLNHRAHGVQLCQRPSYLLGVLAVTELHHSQSRCACQHVAVTALEEALGIAVVIVALGILHRHVVKLAAVPGLEGTVHAEVEQPTAVLHHAVHIITI